jgi:hypothetical protein
MKIRKGRFSGTIGQEVYVNSKHGQVVRSRPRRPWRPTPARLGVQHNLDLVVRAWRSLTRKQHDAWTAAARKENMNTYTFFTRINGALAAAKLPLLMEPPKREKLRPSPVGELEILNRSGVITLRLIKEYSVGNTGLPPECIHGCRLVAGMLQACCRLV